MKKYILALAAFLISAPAAHADWFADYVRYSSSAELGEITIESGRLRGKHAVLRAQKKVNSLAKENLFVGAGNDDMRYIRNCKIGNHTVVSKIVMRPPIGHGYGGNNYTYELTATIDGREKIHCNLGYLAQDNNLHVQKIVIYPEDQFIEVSASAGAGNKMVNPPIRHCLFSDPHVISNDSLVYAR